MSSKLSPIDCLAVEVAVKLYDELEKDDEVFPYEYLSEAREIVRLASGEPGNDGLPSIIAGVLSEFLEFNYQPESFTDVASFINERLATLRKLSQI